MRFGFKASAAVAAMAGALGATKEMALNLVNQRDPIPRVKGKNKQTRSMRRGHYQVYHDTSRFARKNAKFGSEYRPGRLFKGHRV